MNWGKVYFWCSLWHRLLCKNFFWCVLLLYVCKNFWVSFEGVFQCIQCQKHFPNLLAEINFFGSYFSLVFSKFHFLDLFLGYSVLINLGELECFPMHTMSKTFPKLSYEITFQFFNFFIIQITYAGVEIRVPGPIEKVCLWIGSKTWLRIFPGIGA